jgi:peptide/nickel transport system permease protein
VSKRRAPAPIRFLRSFFGRVLLSLPALALILILDFALLHLPGVTVALDLEATSTFDAEALAEHVAATEERFGLDRPLPTQFLDWVGQALTLDLGRSMKEPREVRAILAEAFGPSFRLQVGALFLMFGPGVLLGVWLALRRSRPDEQGLRLLLYGLQAVPEFWLATLFFLFLATHAGWPIFPLEGNAGPGASWWEQLHHLVLPVLALGLPGMAVVARQTRNALLDELRGDVGRALRARGISPTRRIGVYAMRRALIPVALLFGAALPGLVGGSIVVERVFNVRGLGLVLWEATFARDYPVLQALLLAAAVAVILGWALADALVAALDPRAQT